MCHGCPTIIFICQALMRARMHRMVDHFVFSRSWVCYIIFICCCAVSCRNRRILRTILTAVHSVAANPVRACNSNKKTNFGTVQRGEITTKQFIDDSHGGFCVAVYLALARMPCVCKQISTNDANRNSFGRFIAYSFNDSILNVLEWMGSAHTQTLEWCG